MTNMFPLIYEGAIKNGQSRDIGNIWAHKTQDEDKVSFDIRTNKYVFLQYTTAWASETCEALQHCK